ncbi:MAG: GIY-YIG nuclease family protein [Clostridia bacterium]|nr:GIY-YIG nuclease family protein [Clostridia bacterium]
MEQSGVIYILTNPSFPQYVKIGYADNVESRLKQLNNSECIPFAFRIYATYEVEERLTDLKLHALIDQLNPNLRSIDNVDGKKRVREFYAMSPEQAYSILETIAVLGGRKDRLHLYEPTAVERQSEEMAQDIEEQHIERMAPFTFSKCNIPVGATITFVSQGNANSGVQCSVVDDKTVEYEGRKSSLSALASELLGSKWGVAGPRYFKYNGEWLNDIRAKAEGRQVSSRLDDVWVIPCNPKYYDIVAAFDNLDVIEWSQSTNTSVGDTVYIYVGEKYKAIMYKCEVVAADLYGNRSDEDYPYYKELAKDPDIRYMKLKLIEKYAPDKYPLKELKENGLSSVQGRSKATVQLMKYLKDN